MAAKLGHCRRSPASSRCRTFIPDDQQQKLPLIADAAKTLDPALNPAAPSPPPTDAQNVSMMNSTIDVLNRLAGTAPGPARSRRGGWRPRWRALAKADPATRQRAEAVFVQPLRTALDELRNLFKAQEVTRDNLPPELASQWVTPDGQARIDVAPKGDSNNNDVLRKFAHAVQSVAPDATEGPISILEARRAIVTAFIEAGACALISIGICSGSRCAGSATCC